MNTPVPCGCPVCQSCVQDLLQHTDTQTHRHTDTHTGIQTHTQAFRHTHRHVHSPLRSNHRPQHSFVYRSLDEDFLDKKVKTFLSFCLLNIFLPIILSNAQHNSLPLFLSFSCRHQNIYTYPHTSTSTFSLSQHTYTHAHAHAHKHALTPDTRIPIKPPQ